MIFLYVAGIYALGWSVLYLFYKALLKELRWGYALGISWAVGNAVVGTIFFFLAYIDRFSVENVVIVVALLGLGSLGVMLTGLMHFSPTKKGLMRLLPILIIGGFFIHLIQHSLTAYLIDWDATAIWFLKAKALFVSNGFWHNEYFSDNALYDFSNKTYPVGIPLIMAGFFKMIRFFNDQVIQFYFIQYFLLLVIIIYEMLTEYTKFSMFSRLLVAIGLFSTPTFLNFAHSGYVDLPLSFFFLIMMLLYVKLSREVEPAKKILWLSVLFCVGLFSIQVKNEGITFAGMLIGLSVMSMRKIPLRRVFYYLLPGVIVFASIIAWKYFVHTKHLAFYLEGTRLGADALTRAKMSINYYLEVFLNTQIHNLTTIPVLMIVAYQIPQLARTRRMRYIAPLIIITLQFAIYTYVYMITPMPFDLQLHTSFPRLLLHLLPGLYAAVIYQQSGVEG